MVYLLGFVHWMTGPQYDDGERWQNLRASWGLSRHWDMSLEGVSFHGSLPRSCDWLLGEPTQCTWPHFLSAVSLTLCHVLMQPRVHLSEADDETLSVSDLKLLNPRSK